MGFSGQTTVKYLDLSWNNIPANGMKIILKLIQHNFLGAEGAKQMVEALKLHPEMRYLDISANEIGSAGFMYFTELFKSNHSL